VSLLILVVDDECDVEMLFRQRFRRDVRVGPATRWILPSRRIPPFNASVTRRVPKFKSELSSCKGRIIEPLLRRRRGEQVGGVIRCHVGHGTRSSIRF
jgi:hypothetical protein